MNKKILTYVIGAFLIGAGVLLIINPKESISGIIYNFGLVLFIVSLINLILLIIKKTSIVLSSNTFVTMILGIVLMVSANSMLSIISKIIGIYMIINSVLTFNSLSHIKNNDLITRKKVSAIIKFILGIIIISTPIISYVLTGLVLGILLILVGIYFIVNNNDNDDVIYKVKVK